MESDLEKRTRETRSVHLMYSAGMFTKEESEQMLSAIRSNHTPKATFYILNGGDGGGDIMPAEMPKVVRPQAPKEQPATESQVVSKGMTIDELFPSGSNTLNANHVIEYKKRTKKNLEIVPTEFVIEPRMNNDPSQGTGLFAHFEPIEIDGMGGTIERMAINKTNAKSIATYLGNEPALWVGATLTLSTQVTNLDNKPGIIVVDVKSPE